MSTASRAVKESKAVADLAVAAAKNELIEQLTPTIKSIIDGQLRKGALGADAAALRGEGVNRMRQAADGYDGITDFEEGKDMKDKDKLESVSALFPTISEMADDDGVDEASEVDEAYDDVDEGSEVDEASDMEEELEISNEEMEAMYAEALQLEVEVKKGFSDMAKPHDLGAGAKAAYQSDPANLADYAGGEKEWDDVEPPAKQKWTVEQIRKMVRQGVAENRELATQNAKLRENVTKLVKKLSEMNLLNSKILHVNKFLSAHRLTAEQKKSVIESIDKGTTVKEVKSIYSVIESTFKASGAVNESAARKPRADSQKRRTSGGANPRVIRESADRADNGGFQNRWTQLAGIKKLVNG